jgi:3-dehydroquinate synthase
MLEEYRMRRVRVRLGARKGYDVMVGAGALNGLGSVARFSVSPDARRVAVISNRRVFDLYGAAALGSLRRAGFKVTYWLMGDGERHKSLRTAERALRFLAASKLERSDAVVALGGGVVGDLAGFAAALYLRGVSVMQVPTTLLAQIDSSIGGKTGVNTNEGKNLVGAFHQPRAVLIDTATLKTLPRRELTAGWCEAIKHGAVGDLNLFLRTVKFLSGERAAGRGRGGRGDVETELTRLIAAQCAFKAKIVSGDEREDLGRTDARSRRVLNFGHTTGHALESVTNYRRFRHGEAVGYGMLVAAEISNRLGLLKLPELQSLREAVRLAGQLPRADDIPVASIRKAISGDKKSVGGHVRWILLEKLGRARVVDGRDIPARVVQAAIETALRRHV